MSRTHSYKQLVMLFITLGILVLSACNLGASPDADQDITSVPTNSAAATRTQIPTSGPAIPVTVTTIPIPVQQVGFTPAVILPPITNLIPTSTSVPISIVMFSPAPGNVVSGNVQVLGSAIHPQFLQYRLEYGPDPNPNNLWFPITGVVQTPVLTDTLGIWNTNTTPDGVYQLRLRVFLRDGREQTTVINNIRVQNQAPTPVPTPTLAIPRPIAAYTQDFTTGDAPLVVSFINLSQGQISSYSWDFGDGGNNNAANPVHTFNSPGVYNVILTVVGPGGNANVSRQIIVQSPAAPVAAFTPDQISGEAPLSVIFTNESTGNITSNNWDFGDGNSSTEGTPSHTFTDVGSYNVILEVTGSGGSSTMIRQITVENPQVPAPIAGFTSDTATGDIPLTVQFTNTTQGDVTSYLWDFDGDGITDSIDQDPTHIYTLAGTYDVQLTVIGPGGQDSASTQIVAVQPPDAPIANFSASPLTGDAPLSVTLTNASTGDITGYVWDFDNDGQPDSTDTSPVHTFQTPGTYIVTLVANGPGGSSNAQETISVTIPIAPPIAAFVPSATVGEAPLNIGFTNTSQGDQLSYTWDFDGDGATDSTETSPSFEYTVAGIYTVTLTVSNPVGSDTASEQINVSETVVLLPPTAAFLANPDNGAAPLTVTFTNQSFGDITGYEWDFDNDGAVDNTETNPINVFSAAGTYTVTLTAIGPGGQNSISSIITVNVPLTPPVASFTANPTSGTAPLTVVFADASQGTIDGYSWDFDGDGIADSTDANPTFTYNNAGTFFPALTVSNAAGSDTINAQVDVTAALTPPIASFTANPTSGTAPLTVVFADASQGTIDSYSWDFDGDGIADSTDANPTFTYNNAGTFFPALTVSNAAGSDTINAQIDVTAALTPPVASFTANPTSGTAPLTVVFADASQGTIDGYSWDFDGDGIADSTDANPTFTYNNAGTFFPALTVSNAAGSDTINAQVDVTAALTPPIASFTANPTSGTAPLTVVFVDASQGTIDGYSWDFDGDGVADSFDANPTFTYNNAGTFFPVLTVSNAAGSDTINAQIDVTAALTPPVASFTANPTSGTAPLTVVFADASQGTIDGYSWDFDGDGVADSFDANPTFTYNNAGTFFPALTVSNAAGSDTINAQIDVTAALTPPVASFTANPTSGTVPLTVVFADASQGTIDGYSWDFDGDGVADDTDANPTFTYNNAGTFFPALTVSNAAGSDTINAQIDVTAALTPPIASFAANPTSGTAPLTVVFADASQGTIDGYSWDFDGDGIADSTDANPTFIYNNAGTFFPALTVSNAAGSDTINAQIDVTAALTPPVASFTANPTSGTAPLTVVFADASQGTIDGYSWDFDGDGIADSTDANPTFTYNNAGTFFPALTVSNAAGSDTINAQIDVTAALTPPVASFTANPTAGTAPLTVVFTDTSQGSVELYQWDFDGDGIADNFDANPTFVYNNAGTFFPTLTVSNAAGSNTANAQIDVTADVPPPASPSGEVAFVTNRDGNNEIYVMNSDGSGAVNVSNHGANDSQPSWSPDGSQLVFTSDRDGNNEIYILKISDLTVTRITNDGANDSQPAWSPDGSMIAFVSDRQGDNDIYTMNVDGSGVTQLTVDAANDQQPAWSPDNNQLVFVSDRTTGENNLYTMSAADGSGLTQLTTDAANDRHPDWSPDGSAVVFTSDRLGDNDIYAINVFDLSILQITTNSANDQLANWLPNSASIFFVSDRDTGNNNIYTMNTDGSGITQLTNDGANDHSPDRKP